MIHAHRAHTPMTGSADKYPQGFFKDKPCKLCATQFTPVAPSEKYCSVKCKEFMHRLHYYKRVYGITVQQWIEMYDRQGGLCAICRTEGFTMKAHHQAKLNVDHCHSTGVVRGLLCHNCNRALGLLQDSPAHLQRALAYLERATTIPKGSSPKQGEAHGPSRKRVKR